MIYNIIWEREASHFPKVAPLVLDSFAPCIHEVVEMRLGSLWICSSEFSQLRLSLLPVLLRPFPQDLPLDLPRWTLWHLIDEDHTARQTLIFRNLALDPLLYLFRARRTFRLELDVSSRIFLGVEGGLDADYARIGNGWVGKEDGFEFCRGDLVAGDFDEFLCTQDQRQSAGCALGEGLTFNRSTM